MPIEETGRESMGKARATCDGCGHVEDVRADYQGRPGQKTKLNIGQVQRRLTGQGWSWIKGRLRCPDCEVKRKAELAMKAQTKETEAQSPSEPSKAQKREIMQLLESVYDTSAERYKGGESDATVADLCGVLPGWVAELREEFFGPDGGSEEIERLEAEIAAFLAEAVPARARALEEAERLGALMQRAQAFAGELGKIKRAVGPRALQKAGVK